MPAIAHLLAALPIPFFSELGDILTGFWAGPAFFPISRNSGFWLPLEQTNFRLTLLFPGSASFF